jgi:hypothetical protein
MRLCGLRAMVCLSWCSPKKNAPSWVREMLQLEYRERKQGNLQRLHRTAITVKLEPMDYPRTCLNIFAIWLSFEISNFFAY